MSFAQPLTLFLLLPALGALAWRLSGASGLPAGQLPGDWVRVVEPPLRRFMASGALAGVRVSLLLPLSIWVLLVLALARPALDTGAAADYSNIAGRVIALDLGAGANIHSQRLAATRLMEDLPGVPTAIVVGTGDAFDVVPLTTDRAYVDRYLQVITPDVMPLDGRSLGVAIAHGEAILTRAGIVAGQVVVLSAGKPPTYSSGDARWPRAVVVEAKDREAWAPYVATIGASLGAVDDLSAVQRELQNDIDRARRDGDRQGRTELAPYLLTVAMVLWLVLFRRQRAA